MTSRPSWHAEACSLQLRQAADPEDGLAEVGRKNGKRGVLGRICWCVACYDFLLMFNVFSLLLMFCVGGSGVFGVLTFLGQMV